MVRTWHIKCPGNGLDATADSLGISQLQRNLQSQAMDRCTFVHNTGDMTAAALFPYKSEVEVYYKDDNGDPVTWFIGRSNTVPRSGSPDVEFVQYEILGPWYYLERTLYLQNWKMSQGNTPVWTRSARIILGQGEDGTKTTTGNQIKEALEYGISQRGIPLQLPADTSGWPDVKVPFDMTKDLNISDVINRLLQYTPDYAACIDYSTAPYPTFLIYKRAAAPAVNVSLLDTETQSLQITPRFDLVPAGIVINFDSTNTVDGTDYISRVSQTAGNPDSFDTQTITIELSGYKSSSQVHIVTTEDWPAEFTDKTWWKNQDRSIADIPDANIILSDPATDYPGGLAALTSSYPKILTGGGFPDWLSDRLKTETLAATVDCSISVTARLTIPKPNGAAPDIRTVTLSASLTATLAETGSDNRRRYSKTNITNTGEQPPANMASKLYASWSILQYEGSLAKENVEVSGTILPGFRLNITNGISEWASMNAQIQTVTESADDGITSIQFGPAKHISPDDLKSILSRFRRILPPGGYMNARQSGKKDDIDVDATQTGGRPPKNNTSSKTDSFDKINLDSYDPDDDIRNSISLDPDSIETPEDGADVEIKPRQIELLELSDPDAPIPAGRKIKLQALVSDELDKPSSGEEEKYLFVPEIPDGSDDANLVFDKTEAKLKWDGTPKIPDDKIIIPKPSGTTPGILIYDPSDSSTPIKWIYGNTKYTYLGIKSDNSLGFDYPRYN